MGSIQIITWNVDGLCNPNRKHIICNWINKLKKKPSILCLQEVNASGFLLTTVLSFILPGYTQIIAAPVIAMVGL